MDDSMAGHFFDIGWHNKTSYGECPSDGMIRPQNRPWSDESWQYWNRPRRPRLTREEWIEKQRGDPRAAFADDEEEEQDMAMTVVEKRVERIELTATDREVKLKFTRSRKKPGALTIYTEGLGQENLTFHIEEDEKPAFLEAIRGLVDVE